VKNLHRLELSVRRDLLFAQPETKTPRNFQIGFLKLEIITVQQILEMFFRALAEERLCLREII